MTLLEDTQLTLHVGKLYATICKFGTKQIKDRTIKMMQIVESSLIYKGKFKSSFMFH